MAEIPRISDQLKRAFEGPAWHGPSVREALSGVTAGVAAARPIPGAHSIWEIVLHIATWEDVVRRRLAGLRAEPTDAEDWPAVTDTGEEAWKAAIETLERGHHALRQAVTKFQDEWLDSAPPAKYPVSAYALLHGVIQHDLYHAGQIVLLRKGAGS